jgi:hypothetical protein
MHRANEQLILAGSCCLPHARNCPSCKLPVDGCNASTLLGTTQRKHMAAFGPTAGSETAAAAAAAAQN